MLLLGVLMLPVNAGRGMEVLEMGEGDTCFYFSFSKHFGFCTDLIYLDLFVNLFIVNLFFC